MEPGGWVSISSLREAMAERGKPFAMPFYGGGGGLVVCDFAFTTGRIHGNKRP